eukprot:2345887-Pyramimonas_sp.AAC.1
MQGKQKGGRKGYQRGVDGGGERRRLLGAVEPQEKTAAFSLSKGGSGQGKRNPNSIAQRRASLAKRKRPTERRETEGRSPEYSLGVTNGGVGAEQVGQPEDNADITAVVSKSSADFIQGLVEDAKAKGATLYQ